MRESDRLYTYCSNDIFCKLSDPGIKYLAHTLEIHYTTLKHGLSLFYYNIFVK